MLLLAPLLATRRMTESVSLATAHCSPVTGRKSSPRSCLDSSRRQELLQFKPPDVVPRACAQQIWSGGYFYRKLTERVKSLNELKGFQETDRQADRTRETGRWTSDVPAGSPRRPRCVGREAKNGWRWIG